jgi:phage shock protein PspC (stress-responsive transcriptional regulator)
MNADASSYKELRRSRDDRMIAGVCGGLGRYFDVNPAFYRVGFVVLALLGGAGILIYGAALLVIPNDGEEDSVATQVLRDHRQQPWALVALAIVAVAGLSLLSHATLWPHGDAAWIFLLVAGGIILWAQRREAGKRPRVLRTILIAVGAVLALVLVAGAVVMSVSGVHVSRGIGDRNYAPASLVGLQRSYKLGVGSLRLDLSNVQFPSGDTKVDADVGIGDVTVIVPPEISVHVDGTADIGQVQVFDRTADGRHSSLTSTSVVGEGNRLLLIHAHVGTGKIEVRRALG